MTFEKYWQDHEPFGCTPEEVARLAYDFALTHVNALHNRIRELEGEIQRLEVELRTRDEEWHALEQWQRNSFQSGTSG